MRKYTKVIIALLISTAVIFSTLMLITRPYRVEAQMIQLKTWEISFEEKGEVFDPDEFQIFSEFGGLISESFFKDGDLVSVGDTLFIFDTVNQENLLKQYKNQLIALEGEIEQSRIDFGLQSNTIKSQISQLTIQKKLQEEVLSSIQKKHDDIEYLYESGSIPKKDLDEVRLSLNEAQSAIDRVKSQISSYNKDLSSLDISGMLSRIEAEKNILTDSIAEIQRIINGSTIIASHSGQLKYPLKQGQTIPAGTLLVTIVPQKSLELECFVRSSDIGGIAVGDVAEATLRQNTGNSVFPVTVKKIENEAKDIHGISGKRVRVLLELPENASTQLRSGFELNVRFVTSHVDNSIILPKSAIFEDNGVTAIWIILDGKSVKTPVSIGAEYFGNVLIESDLPPNSLVVTSAVDRIKEGQRLAAI